MITAASTSINLGQVFIGVVGLILAVPTSVLAFRSLEDRSHRLEEQVERRKEKRLVELVVKALVGEHAIRDPGGAEETIRNAPSLTSTLQAAAHQLQPSNGKTVAKMVEEVRSESMRLAVLVGEHMSDGHGGQIWPDGT